MLHFAGHDCFRLGFRFVREFHKHGLLNRRFWSLLLLYYKGQVLTWLA